MPSKVYGRSLSDQFIIMRLESAAQFSHRKNKARLYPCWYEIRAENINVYVFMMVLEQSLSG